MIAADDLLISISEENPCGEDLSYDPGLQELDTIARGKPETQFSEAEAPDWNHLRSRCLELFARSKDLRITILLSAASLQLDGLPGFRESLLLIKGLLEKFWTLVHPQLDPGDNDDPLQRMNIIASLATPVGTFGDPVRILERLRAAPLCDSVQMGRFGLADIVRAETALPSGDEKPAISVAQIDAAFRDSNPEQLKKIYSALSDSIALVQWIDEFLTATVGPSNAPDLNPLSAELISMQRRTAVHLPTVISATDQSAGSSTGAPGESRIAVSVPGEIRSREDVVKTLQKISEYYARTEPSSPVPLILKRAARLADMDFMQIIKDMSPDAISQIRGITGEPEE
jgi:type VI secretion system protein ImpA